MIKDLSDDEARRALVLKWGTVDADVIPAWVAEMDYALAPPVAAALSEEDIATVLEEFRRLILAYRDPARGYTSRRAMVEMAAKGDYDDLARHGEWAITDPARPEDVQ